MKRLAMYATAILSLALSVGGIRAQDCNGNGWNDWTELQYALSQDCNWNEIPDECEVYDPSRDCDGNGVPDDCQPDCDLDGVPDACELLSGEEDCNRDGRPDSCELVPTLRYEGPTALAPPGGRGNYMAAADFDRDGRLDLVFSSYGRAADLLFYSRGDRSFSPAFTLPDSATEAEFIPADFNGDGFPDLASVSVLERIVTIHLNRRGGFSTAKFELEFSLGYAPSGGAAADFDGDADIDIALIEPLLILENSGDGTFTVSSPGAAALGTSRLAAGDLDGDGDPDLVALRGYPGEIAFFENLGNKQFAESARSTCAQPNEIALGDFDGDGRLDIAVLCYGSGPDGKLQILLKRTDFVEAATYEIGNDVRSIAVADFNGDGQLDVAIGATGETWTGDKVVLLAGRGDGTFSLVGLIPDAGLRILAGDFDGDRRTDLASSRSWVENGIVISWNEGDSGFASLRAIEIGPELSGMAVGDLDDDGDPDFAVVRAADPSYALPLLNTGGGRFSFGTAVPLPDAPSAVALGDFDRDRDIDMAVGLGSKPASLAILQNSGNGEFAITQRLTLGTQVGALATGDLDSDGALDVVATDEAWSGRVDVLWGAGDGSFVVTGFYCGFEYAGPVAVADIDLDGRLDLVVGQAQDRSGIWSFRNLGNREFDTRKLLSWYQKMAVADVNGDGAPDIAVVSYSGSGGVGILRNDGRGGVSDVDYVARNSLGFRGVLAADLNRDGRTELILSGNYASELQVFFFGPRGRISPPVGLACYGHPTHLAAADFNGDGILDIAAAVPHLGHILVIPSRLEPPRSSDRDGDGILDECGPMFIRCDANADGKSDITDGIQILAFIFRGRPIGPCAKSADCNADGELNISDALFAIAYQFFGGQAPLPPFPSCGVDASKSELPCAAYPPCGPR